jgi:hypothetical protein
MRRASQRMCLTETHGIKFPPCAQQLVRPSPALVTGITLASAQSPGGGEHRQSPSATTSGGSSGGGGDRRMNQPSGGGTQGQGGERSLDAQGKGSPSGHKGESGMAADRDDQKMGGTRDRVAMSTAWRDSVSKPHHPPVLFFQCSAQRRRTNIIPNKKPAATATAIAVNGCRSIETLSASPTDTVASRT